MAINIRGQRTRLKKSHAVVLSVLIMNVYCVGQPSYAQEFYKWVDSNGSTHYTTTMPPKNSKRLGFVYTPSDTAKQFKQTPTAKQQPQNPYQHPFPNERKVELTTAERAEIEMKAKQQIKKYKVEPHDPYANFFGVATEQDIRHSMEVEYLEKKQKLAHSQALKY